LGQCVGHWKISTAFYLRERYYLLVLVLVGQEARPVVMEDRLV
jgi:hypothetical protein